MRLLTERFFTHLNLYNEWESLSYKTDDGKTVPLLPEGDIWVLWPDGFTSKERLVHERYSTQYDDMGHTYTASGICPAIECDHHGISFRLKLSDLAGICLPE